LLRQLLDLEPASERETRLGGILLGEDAETGEAVFWNPDPGIGAANPHMLVLGESGFGKTYTIACLLAELARKEVVSIVFDYGQGFSPSPLPPEFQAATDLVELHAGRDEVDIYPLQIFPSDLHGPVAKRVTDDRRPVVLRIPQRRITIRPRPPDGARRIGSLERRGKLWPV
jgi:DNA helicase HerA-like ATPase